MSDESGDGARNGSSAGDGSSTGDGSSADEGGSAEFGDRSRANATGDESPADEAEWRFSVDEVGPDGVTEDTHTPESEPIEPGDVDLEHAIFVVLGVALTVGVLVVGF